MEITNKRLAALAARLGLYKPEPKTVDSILQAFTSTITELEDVAKLEQQKVQQHIEAEKAAKKVYDEAIAKAQAGQEAGNKEVERSKQVVERFKALAGI